MAAYDSESSEGEEDYSETNVLLGYASREATDDAISHLGGQPAWLDTSTLPSGDLAKCKVCNDLLSLLLELNADLPERFPGHERRLYVFGCRRGTCRRKEGSVRSIRAVRSNRAASTSTTTRSLPSSQPAQPQDKEEQHKPDLGSSIFGSKPSTANGSHANPFSKPSSTQNATNPFASAPSLASKPAQRPAPDDGPSAPTTLAAESVADSSALAQTFADKVRINASPASVPNPPTTRTPWPPQSAFSAPYPNYHLDADYESLDASPPTVPQNTRLDQSMDIDDEGDAAASTNGASGADKETFESSMDRVFQRFADRVGQNPEQVLRYEFGGTPLLYADKDAVGKILDKDRVPRCTLCGAKRVFEVQLTPHAIVELESEQEGLEGMEWGTVVLEVCSQDCVPEGVDIGQVGYAEEWVGVQWEEQVVRR